MMWHTKCLNPVSQEEVPAFSPDLFVTDWHEDGQGQQQVPVAVEAGSGTVRRDERGERRRMIDPSTCLRDYSTDEIEFMKAMDQYKRANRRPFPTWSEVLDVVRALGYRKGAEPTEMPVRSTPMAPNVEA